MKKYLFLVILPLFVAVGALTGATDAQAASEYDNVVNTTSSLKLHTPSTCSRVSDFDFKLRWSEFLSQSVYDNGFTIPDEENVSVTYDPGSVDMSTMFYSWSIAENWAVSNFTVLDDKQIFITFTTESNTTLDFTTDNFDQKVLAPAKSVNTYHLTIQVNTSCQIVVYARNDLIPGSQPVAHNLDPVVKLDVLFAFWDINYPSGYEGTQPPDSVENPETSNWTPNFYVSQANDWKASIHDQNFNTIDGNPFLCGGEFAPIIHYEMWFRILEEETKIGEGSYSATAPLEFQFEKAPVSQNFRIVGWYTCGPGELQFNNSSYKDFTIDSRGKLYITGLETCVQEFFPFISWDSCITGFNDILATLAFNVQDPVNNGIIMASSANPNGCYDMQVLHTWIQLPSQRICSAVPQYVRDIVTPFVTFVLGALVFTYISRSKASVIS